jgi:hypothetical protein
MHEGSHVHVAWGRKVKYEKKEYKAPGLELNTILYICTASTRVH